MSDEAAFLRAIQADPADATAKLVYADWLDEHGAGEKAEYLRLSVRLQSQPKRDHPEYRRLHQLEYRHHVWVELVRGLPVWDEVTMFALGRLCGLLETFATLNGHDSDISFDWGARLEPRTGPLEEMAAAHFGPDYTPANLEPLADWEADLGAIFREWLFIRVTTPE